jgi:type III secretion system YscQ/HrcQ family protein
LSESLLPDGWWEPGEAGSAATILLEFSVSNGEQETARGELSIPPQSCTKLAAAHAAGEGKATDLEPWAQRLGAELHVVLPSVEFPRLDLVAGCIGDVFVLGDRRNCWERLVLRYATRAWRCFYDQGRIQVASGALDDSTRTVMSQPISPETAGGARVSSLESIPVSLEFDLGSLSVPLGELAALGPGYVFELPMRLEHARVVIRANGTPIGQGELVAAGDTLGVQLLSIDANGLR